MKASIVDMELLKNISPFQTLSATEFNNLNVYFKIMKYKPNEVIFRRNDPGNSIFFIVKGEVAIQVPSKSDVFQTISTLGENSFFGEMSVLTGERRSATVITTQNTTLLSICREDFLKIISKHPSINLYFQKLLAKRVVSANEQVAELIQTRDIANMQVIKEGNIFMAYNHFGDIPANNTAGFGLYKEDTRYLCFYDLFICGERPILLHSSCDGNYIGETEMTNPTLFLDNANVLSNGMLGISRKKSICNKFKETITLKNFSREDVGVDLSFNFASDFRDIFEIRGLLAREKRGENLPVKKGKNAVTFSYEGLDGNIYVTTIRFQPFPDGLIEQKASFKLALKPRQSISIFCEIEAQSYKKEKHFVVLSNGANSLENNYNLWKQECTAIKTDNAIFNLVVNRSVSDLRLLQSHVNGNLYFDAGIPWYSALFGRDSIITSLQSLILNLNVPASILEILASKQGSKINPSKDEEPGKILHELRNGELANNNEIPHTPYYGTVDATPLWIVLLSELYNWTGNKELIEKFWKNAKDANKWIDECGDGDNDGYVEYIRKSEIGLINQGWKDSTEAIAEKDGSLAEMPVALVEVQGYVYDAKLRLARLARAIGENDFSTQLENQAHALRKNFNRDFWVPEPGGYLAIALNGKKKKVAAVSSNQGHALWSGILDDKKAEVVRERLFREDMFSGWGIRTLSSEEVSYNPFGYHIGSIWPHDNAIIASGLKKYGFADEALKLFSLISKAARFFEGFRLPELFCGFSSKEKFIPVPYPLACRPQAWAAGSIFMFMHSLLGLSPDPQSKTLVIDKPVLPYWLNQLEISNLKVFNASIDLEFKRNQNKIDVKVTKNERKIKIERV
jgi:glycogen debranching enzyme